MANSQMSAAPKERPLANVATQHRLNHVSFGHLGRIAYSPVNDGGGQVGVLQTSRTPESKLHFKLLARFAEVCPPTRSAVPEVWLDKKPSDAARLQKSLLLATYPEAAAGGDVHAQLLREELLRLKTAAAEDVANTTSSLLTVGEVTDGTEPKHGIIGRPAIAMAAGAGGHVLHIVSLDQEDVVWQDEDLVMHIPKVSASARGEWVEDGVPITTIRFAVDGRRNDTIRWLMVQKPTGTTLFEPALNIMPNQGNISEYEQSHLHSHLPRYISANPLLTIKAEKTGGSAHLHVGFNPVVNGRSPQLAIIDKAGQWSVWDITGSRSARLKVLQPIITVRGTVHPSPVPSLHSKIGIDLATYKLLWVVPKAHGRIKREDEQETFEDRHWGLYSRSPIRSKHLIVCSDTDVRLYDAIKGTQLAGIRVVNIDRAESIVAMQSCPISASQAFVLTTKSLYWLDTKATRDGHVKIGVIFSFPHHKSASHGGLILTVSPLTGSARRRSRAAFIMSGQDKATDMFILTDPSAAEAAHIVHQVICPDLPSSIRSVFISPVPTGRIEGVRGKALSNGASVSNLEHLRLFQLFGVNSNLSLGSALFATSDTSLQDFEAPRTLNGTIQSDTRRKRFLHHIEKAFVVPETYEERLPALRPSTETPRPRRNLAQKKPTVIDLNTARERLAELVSSEIEPAKMSRQLLAGVIHRRGMEELGDGEYMRARTLAELVGDKLTGCNHETMEEEWNSFRSQLNSAYDGKVRVAELTIKNQPEGFPGLIQQLSKLLCVYDDAPELYRERQRHLLRHIAGKQYLSLFGISVVPPSVPAITEGEDISSQGFSQHMDDQYLLRSSPTPSRPQSRHSQDLMDTDEEPTPARIPDSGPLALLRQYIDIPTSAATEALSQPSQTRLLSHWPGTPGSDPWSFVWEEDEGPLTAEDEEAILKRQKREEALRKRRQKQRLSARSSMKEDSAGPSTQPAYAPRTVQSSQPRGEEESLSQGQTQSQRPRISMSQVVRGPHGGRQAAKKKKGKSGFR